MLEHKVLQNLDEYFWELNRRDGRGVFFYRINGYSDTVRSFIRKYYEAARLAGVVIEGKIPNPNEQNLSYYSEIMGMDFQMSMGFLTSSLRKWLPRMNDIQRRNVAESMYDTLDLMRREGKNGNMLKNAYIKFMCWLYYKFERIVNQLGNDKLPKILYEGDISNYELKLITILSNAGCDVVLLQYHGDTAYLSLDRESKHSAAFPMQGLTAFPENFSMKQLRQEWEEEARIQRIYGPLPEITNCTNAWIEGKWIEDITRGIQARGAAPDLFYNCFFQITGVEDKLTYLNELYQMYLQLKNTGRKVVVVNQEIEKPSVEEIAQVKRSTYTNFEQMAMELSSNIQYPVDRELQKLMRKSFLDLLLEEKQKPGLSIQKLTNKAIYLLCWLRRYQQQLFAGWRAPEIACFLYLGGGREETECLFLRLLSRLPADVLVLAPNQNRKSCLEDRFLFEVKYEDSMEVDRFPCDNSDVQMGTSAYHAERELDELMYQNSGIYRNKQCSKASTIVLKTMYEEIFLLWNEELKYRPNFSVVEDVVNIPAVFAKVSGVKDRDVQKYWSDIKKLMVEDSFVVKEVPFIRPADPNPMKQYAVEFLKNGKLMRNKVKSHRAYPYGFLREEIQDYLLDKLQLLLDHKSIRGTYENGTEYTIVAVVLNLNKQLLRLLQKFDFTQKNPKFIYINTTENMISLEDSIITAFLSLVGFDIVFFVPTGYQTVERYFNQKVLEEHQIGDYIYDLNPPDFNTVTVDSHQSWREKLFRRGS